MDREGYTPKGRGLTKGKGLPKAPQGGTGEVSICKCIKPIVERHCGESAGPTDSIDIKVGTLTLEISVPIGHSADNVDIRYRYGENGYTDC